MGTDMDALFDDCASLMRKHVDVIKSLQGKTDRELTDEESEAIVRYAKLIASWKKDRARQKLGDLKTKELLDGLPPEVRKLIEVTDDDE